MARKALAYGAGLIALSIIVYRSSNAGMLLDKGAAAASTVVNSFPVNK